MNWLLKNEIKNKTKKNTKVGSWSASFPLFFVPILLYISSTSSQIWILGKTDCFQI